MIYSHKRTLLTRERVNSLPRFLSLQAFFFCDQISLSLSFSLFFSLSLSLVHLYSCHQVGKRRKYNQGGLWRHVWGHCGPLILYRTCLLWGHQPSRQHQRQPQRWRLLWVDHQIFTPFQKCDIAPRWATERRRVSGVCRPQSAPAWLLNLSPCRWTLALTLSSTAPGQEIPLWPSCGWRGGLEWWELHSISLSSTSHVVASGFEKVYLWEFVKIKERKRLMSWRDDSPTWTSSDPEFTSIPAFLCQHQRPNSSTFPSLSGNLNWILIIEEKCPLRYKKLYELLWTALLLLQVWSHYHCRKWSLTFFFFFCRFWAMRTSWLWSQWDRRMLGSTCAVLWSHVWERVKRRFLLPSTVGFIFTASSMWILQERTISSPY